METEKVKLLSLAAKSPDVILIIWAAKRETGGKPLDEKRACQKFGRSFGSHIEKRYKETCGIHSTAN